jgi:hypothetical protein
MSYEQTLVPTEKAVLRQADSGKALGSTIERKQMSTKTTLKRIALVAVSALGFGMFTAVVPANAAPATVTSIVVGTVPQGRVGVTSAIPFKIYISGMTANDTLNINAEITSAPLSGGAANVASVLGSSFTTNGGNDNNSGEVFSLSGSSSSNAIITVGDGALQAGRVGTTRPTDGVDTSAGDTDLATASTLPTVVISSAQVALGYIQGYVRITPDVTGTYTGLISTTYYPNNGTYGDVRSAAANEVYSAGDKSASFSFSTTGAPTAMALTTLAGGTILAGSPYGAAVAVTLVGGTLGALDSIDLTASGNGKISIASAANYAATKSLTSSNFAGGQTAVIWLRSSGTAAETITLTATSSGALAAFSATKTFTVKAQDGDATTALVEDAYGSSTTYGDANGSFTSPTLTVANTSTSQTLGFTYAGAAANAGYVTVTDTKGAISGVTGLVWDEYYATGATDEGVSFSQSVNAASYADGSTLWQLSVPAKASSTLGLASATTYSVVTAARATGSTGTFTITPTTAGSKYQVAVGGGVAMTAVLKDRFGNAWAGQTVTITTSGRNNPVATTAVTDAAGKVTFTSVDSSTSTTNLVDTVVFANTYATSKTITLDYANTAASTVTLTGGSTSAGVTALTPTPLEINAGATGAQATTHTVTALVKDASGNAIVGKLVTWTISGTGCALLSTKGTSYTSTTGEATTSAYGWLQGTCTVTATVGTVSGTASLYFTQTGTGEARTVSATVSGSVVTANVKDRFGNPIKGVTIYATKTGTGYFGSGLGRTTAVTDLSGNAQFSVAGGDATVTVSVVDYDLPAGSTFGQTAALKGYGTNPTATTSGTALTATTAGTATTAETGVGASYDAAGVASATVSVTGVNSAVEAAADAAAEAIDAANAATDAANLAAEAADAATVAAEEARDAADAATAAVEELATQVATLMAALKAQITTLANTVAKIAKKVKA